MKNIILIFTSALILFVGCYSTGDSRDNVNDIDEIIDFLDLPDEPLDLEGYNKVIDLLREEGYLDNYGGLYVSDYQESYNDYNINICIKEYGIYEENLFKKINYIREVNIIDVDYSYEELIKIRNILIDELEDNFNIIGYGINVYENKVSIRVTKESDELLNYIEEKNYLDVIGIELDDLPIAQ